MSIRSPAVLGALGVSAVATAAVIGGYLLLSGGSAQASSTVLTVLAGDVQVQDAAGDSPRAAVDGEVLDAGDRVITGEGSRAVITFFEGSTQVLEPDTNVTIQDVGTTDGGGLLANMTQAAGTTWNTVLDSSGEGSEVEVAGPAAAAAVRDTMFNVDVLEDGMTTVWTRQGNVAFTGEGEEQLVGHDTIASAQVGSAPGAPADAPDTNSELRVETQGPAWLLLIDPRGLASGCAPEGVPVNQIRLTVITDCLAEGQDLSLLTVIDGTYDLYLSASGAGDFSVFIQGMTGGEVACEQSWTGTVEAGQNWRATFELEVVYGYILSCQASEFELTEEPPPAKYVATDAVLAAISDGRTLIPGLFVVAPTDEPTSEVLGSTATPEPSETPVPSIDLPDTPTLAPGETPRPTSTRTPTPRFTSAPPPNSTRTPTPRSTNTPTRTRTPTRTPTNTPTHTPTPIPTGYLEGAVLHSTTGNGVGGATVQVLGTGQSVTTQGNGYFLVLNLDVGTYTLRFSAPGFVTQDRVVNVTPGANPAVFVSLAKLSP